MNAVSLIGRLTKDIELRKTPSGMSFARFTLAVNRRFKKDQGPDADFISCVAWDKRADVMYQYLRKGSQVGIEGRIETGSYERNGQRVYTTDVVVDNFYFLESRQQRQEYQQQQGNYNLSENPTSSVQSYTYEEPEQIEIDDRDLPF